MIDSQEIYHSKSLALQHIRKALQEYESLPLFKRDLLVKWKKLIRALEEPSELRYETVTPITLGFPTGFFSYLYSPEKILLHLVRENVMPISLSTTLLAPYAEESEMVDMPIEIPIVLAESSLSKRAFCLMGQSTVDQALRSGKRQLPVYDLLEDEHLSLMEDVISRAMYMFHRDLQLLLSQPLMPPMEQFYLPKAPFLLSNETL